MEKSLSGDKNDFRFIWKNCNTNTRWDNLRLNYAYSSEAEAPSTNQNIFFVENTQNVSVVIYILYITLSIKTIIL